MKLIRVGIHLTKNVFQVHGVDCSEKVTWRGRLRREEWIDVVRERAELPDWYGGLRRSASLGASCRGSGIR